MISSVLRTLFAALIACVIAVTGVGLVRSTAGCSPAGEATAVKDVIDVVLCVEDNQDAVDPVVIAKCVRDNVPATDVIKILAKTRENTRRARATCTGDGGPPLAPPDAGSAPTAAKTQTIK